MLNCLVLLNRIQMRGRRTYYILSNIQGFCPEERHRTEPEHYLKGARRGPKRLPVKICLEIPVTVAHTDVEELIGGPHPAASTDVGGHDWREDKTGDEDTHDKEKDTEMSESRPYLAIPLTPPLSVFRPRCAVTWEE